MRPSLSLLPLAVLLAQGIHAQAKDIDVCTQVTRQYITNGDFATDSGWTASDDYTIVTKSGSDSGYIEIPFAADSSVSSTVSFQQDVSNINIGPYYQMDFYWDVIVPDDDFRCDLNVYALQDDGSPYITEAYRIDSAGVSGWTNVLGQWQSTATEITVQFQAVCTGGSGTVRFKDISFKGPEIVCSSQCAASTLMTSGELIQDGDFSPDDFYDYWSTAGYAYPVDDDAPGGGQCMFIPSDSAYYEMNQTIADAQVGQTYHASAMWRVMSPVADGVDMPTCTFDFKIIDLENEILLDLAHMTYSLTTTDSGWMSINGTWNATVSSVIVDIVVSCMYNNDGYYPDMEVADVHFNLQTVTCATPSSSAVASSTPLKSSVSSTPLVRSTPVSRSVSASSTRVSTPYTTPVTAPTTISISIPQSTPVSSVAVSSASYSRSSTPLQSVSSSSSSSFIRSTVSSSSSIITGAASVPSASGSSPASSLPLRSPTVPTSTPSKASVSSVASYTESSSATQSSNPSTPPSVPISSPGQDSTTAPLTPIAGVTSSSPGPLASAPPTSTSTNDPTISSSGSQLTTSTVFTTQTSTITACPSTVTNCPATAKTTYVTTETIVVSTTVCPVAEAEGSLPTTATMSDDGSYTSTILTTRTVTITSCAATVTNCPARSQTTYTSIQTVVAGTTVISAGSLSTISSSTPTEIGLGATKSTAAPSELENASSIGNAKVSKVTATDSIASVNTGVPESDTVSAGSSVFDNTATASISSPEDDFQAISGTAATVTTSKIYSGAPSVPTAGAHTSTGAVSIGMGSNGNGGVSSASSGSPRVSTGASRAPSTAKAAVASTTLASAASASDYHSSTATSVAPAFNGAASLEVAQSGLLGLIAWGLAAMLV